jgi:hypothetical protein
MFLQGLEQAVQNARHRPPPQARVDRVPVAEPLRQGAPFAAVLGDIEHRVDDIEIGDPHVPSLDRHQRADHFMLVFGQPHHAMSLPEITPLNSVNTP